MNKVFCGKRFLISFILTGYLILFNTACGLDTFYVIDAPYRVYHAPEYDELEYTPTENYFEFETEDHEYDGIKFIGTEVYYKIYKSDSELNSTVNVLCDIANNEETSYNAPTKLIDTYKYVPLLAAGHTGENILLPATGSNQRVYIRLSNIGEEYLARILVNNNNIFGDANIVIPVRNITNHYSFNFKELPSDQLPQEDITSNPDYNYSGSSDGEYLYVAMFAVAVAQDNTYARIYSNILYLGSVAIKIQ